MDEKILIRSKVDIKVKTFLRNCTTICSIITAVILIFLILPVKHEYYDPYSGRRTIYRLWFEKFEDAFSGYDIYAVLIFLGAFLLLVAIVTGIMYFMIHKCELQITENSVKGKALFGKEVVLPLYMVSAYSTRKFLSTIAVSTSSGTTKFPLVENYQEIGQVLSKKINERQENAGAIAPAATPTASQPTDITDQLKKFKELLDSGVITQEEFDAKKKQLLGL